MNFIDDGIGNKVIFSVQSSFVSMPIDGIRVKQPNGQRREEKRDSKPEPNGLHINRFYVIASNIVIRIRSLNRLVNLQLSKINPHGCVFVCPLH